MKTYLLRTAAVSPLRGYIRRRRCLGGRVESVAGWRHRSRAARNHTVMVKPAGVSLQLPNHWVQRTRRGP
jgi:hypothetical protein